MVFFVMLQVTPSFSQSKGLFPYATLFRGVCFNRWDWVGACVPVWVCGLIAGIGWVPV